MEHIEIDGVMREAKTLSDRFIILKPIGMPMPRSGRLRKALYKAKTWQCEQCGSKDKIEAHHIEKAIYRKTSKGHYYQDPKSNHKLSNGKLLCRTCHIALHKSMNI